MVEGNPHTNFEDLALAGAYSFIEGSFLQKISIVTDGMFFVARDARTNGGSFVDIDEEPEFHPSTFALGFSEMIGRVKPIVSPKQLNPDVRLRIAEPILASL